MILQALNQYYDRKSTSSEGVLPSYGFEVKNIPVIIEIDIDGNFVQTIVRDEKHPDTNTNEFFPCSVKRSVGIKSNLLWDNVEYVLGIDTRDKPERVAKQHQSFRDRIQSLDTSDASIRAIMCFLNKIDRESIQEDTATWETLEKNPNVSFRIAGEPCLICQKPELREILANTNHSHGKASYCLVTGEENQMERLHPAIKGVWGAQSSGGNIVSFNQDSFKSYGKEQGANAPVGEEASFAYTTTLNHLLRKGSEQRIQVGDASTIFWAEENHSFESDFGTIFGSTPNKVKDDPDAYTRAVKAVFDSVYQGRHEDDVSTNRFYVLGLSPNASRISIRFWQVATVAEISQRIKQHFDYLEITHDPREMPYLPLSFLLESVAVQGKQSNISPNLVGELMRSILAEQPYPFTLLSAAVRRCKVTPSSESKKREDKKYHYPRAALIKACLNRNYQENIKMALDIENTNPAYRLGRLFAVLEKTQEEANPGINATIKDRYYGAASSNPVSVFPTLLKLKNHHLSKLESIGRKIYFEKLIGEIMSEILPDLPASLNLQDQGRFAVGYYHQRQDFFTPKQPKESGEQS